MHLSSSFSTSNASQPWNASADFSAAFDGIGRGRAGDRHDSFRKVRVHGFPQSGDSTAIWADRRVTATAAIVPKLAPAYRKMLDETKDQCGTTTLASKSVGVPFVGCFAAGLVLSEFFRRLTGGTCHEVQELDLRDLGDRELA